MTSIEWLIEQIKEYDFTPPSNNEEYVIVMPKWIFDSKVNESKEMHNQEMAELPKQEISDEEIDNAWEMFRIQNPNTVGGFQEQYASFLFAIRWYREQLKQNL
jgi:hypothetical protein